MAAPKIYIYSGAVHSGKTTRLQAWAAKQNNLDGILAPVLGGKRCLQRIATQEIRQLEQDKSLPKAAVYTVGTFSFSKAVFSWAVEVLQEALVQPLSWLVIDEVGFLELDGQGLEPAVSQALDRYRSSGPEKILIVVRKRLLEKIIAHYNLIGRTEFFILSDSIEE